MKFTPIPVRCALASPWGPMTLAANETALVWAGFDGQRYETDLQQWPMDASHPVLRQTVEQLQQYFAGARQTFDVPLDLGCGTAFQQRVWQALLAIAPGTTSTYGAVSGHIGQPSAVRAVGGAIGRNPISILVPCHRVLGAQGALTGYSGGMDRKIALLQLEGCL